MIFLYENGLANVLLPIGNKQGLISSFRSGLLQSVDSSSLAKRTNGQIRQTA